MPDSPVTRASLLLRLRDRHDADAWSTFVDVYAPLLYGFARKHGLQDADAADLVQNVLRSVARTIDRLDYDPAVGSFRGWLFTIARNQLRDLLAQRRRTMPAGGNSGLERLLQEIPAREEQEEWNAEYERRVFAWAAEQVRPEVQESTWQAFWQTAVEGRVGQEVALSLGMTAAAVYLAKCRVMARLKAKIETLSGETSFCSVAECREPES